MIHPIPSVLPALMSELLSKMFHGVIAQTTMAHRLLLKAWQLGGQQLQLPLLNTMFKSYFSDGQNMADEEILAKAAADNGVMSESEVRSSLSFFPFSGVFSLKALSPSPL